MKAIAPLNGHRVRETCRRISKGNSTRRRKFRDEMRRPRPEISGHMGRICSVFSFPTPRNWRSTRMLLDSGQLPAEAFVALPRAVLKPLRRTWFALVHTGIGRGPDLQGVVHGVKR